MPTLYGTSSPASCVARPWASLHRTCTFLDALPRDTVPGDLLGVLTMMQAAFAYQNQFKPRTVPENVTP